MLKHTPTPKTPNDTPRKRKIKLRHPCWHRCEVCGHAWFERARRTKRYDDDGDPIEPERPDRCPRCKSLKWHEKPKRRKCANCGYEWTERRGSVLSMCPKCKHGRYRTHGFRSAMELLMRSPLIFEDEPQRDAVVRLLAGIPIGTAMKIFNAERDQARAAEIRALLDRLADFT